MVNIQLTSSVLALIFISLHQPFAVQSAATKDPVAKANCRDPENEFHPFCYCRFPIHWDSDICQGGKFFGRPDIEKNLADAAERESRIVGGDFVPVGSYPWFARLTSNNGNSWWGCGGSLITPEYVLTAAHCTQGNTSGIGAQIGALRSPYTTTNGGQAPAQYRNGVSVTNHPNYNGNSMANDFALIRLSSRVTVTPVAVDQNNLSGSYANGKANLWPIGFGTTSSGGSSTSQLKHVETKYVSNSNCNTMYGGGILASMMCAADPGQDSCQGDSGGPLYDSDSNTLVGVVSWGYGCADASYPGVYSRISNQWDDWIKPTICANHSNPKPDFCGSNPAPAPVSPPVSAPVAPPSAACYDNPAGWYDSDGPSYNCDWYAGGNNCVDYGDFFANQGVTANQACCACGGGSSASTNIPTKSPSKAPTVPSKSPTKAPSAFPTKAPTKAPTIPCSDSYENWYDIDGPQYNCEWYADGDNCANYGNFYANPMFGGLTANQACCVCGGGFSGPAPTKSPTMSPTKAPTRSPSKSPTKAPTVAPEPSKSPTKAPTKTPTKVPTKTPTKSPSFSPTKAPIITESPTKLPTKAPSTSPTKAPTGACLDSPENWYDSDGPTYNCDWYASGDNCANYGDSYPNPTFDGATANQACCVCGGGSTVSPPPPPGGCTNASDGSVEVTITTDNYSASENFFFVKNTSNQKVWQEYDLLSNTTNSFQKCLPRDKCYKFTIRDTFGDGLFGGSYSVKWEGNTIKQSSFSSGTRENSPSFGSC